MRPIKMFGLAALAAVATMAFISATSASANTSTQLCTAHTGLTCSGGASSNHFIIVKGSVFKVLGISLFSLCLYILIGSSGGDVGALGNPQRLDTSSMEFSGCGTSAGHDNCTVTVESTPDNTLLKTGLDSGTLEALNGSIRVVCPNLGINCLYDLAGSVSTVGAQHLTANETPVTELGGKFVCPNEGVLDGLLEMLENRYVLG